MITTGMLIVFGGFLLLNSLLVALFFRVNINTQQYIGWLHSKQVEIQDNEDGHIAADKINTAIETFSEWFHQTKMVIIPAVLGVQFLTGIAFGDAIDQTFTHLMSALISIGQAFAIVCFIETAQRVVLTVRVVRDINEEIIKITVGKEIEKEEDKIDKENHNGEE